METRVRIVIDDIVICEGIYETLHPDTQKVVDWILINWRKTRPPKTEPEEAILPFGLNIELKIYGSR